MKGIILIGLGLLLVSVNAFAGTVILQWDVITDPAVAKVDVYHAPAATGPWTKMASEVAPKNTTTFTENVGVWWWGAKAVSTVATGSLESAMSNTPTDVVRPGAPIIIKIPSP